MRRIHMRKSVVTEFVWLDGAMEEPLGWHPMGMTKSHS